jgi:hypothetical protein
LPAIIKLGDFKQQLNPKKYLIKQNLKIFICYFSQKTIPFQKKPLFFNFLLDFQLQDNHNSLFVGCTVAG